jgi:hypothetical protein
VLYLQLFRYRARILEARCDKDQLTPSDFTLMMRGLPRDYVKEDLVAYLSGIRYKIQNLEDINYDIVKVNIAYDIDEYISLLEKQEDLNLELNQCLA